MQNDTPTIIIEKRPIEKGLFIGVNSLVVKCDTSNVSPGVRFPLDA